MAFPPNRTSVALKQVANGFFTIGREKFASSLFATEISRADGFVLKRPAKWK